MGNPRIKLNPGEVAIDPHIHTLFSHCSISQPWRILKWAARLGLGGIAITDHNDIRGALDAMKCADDLKAKNEIPADFLIIPGVEINSTVGHISALFVTENLPAELTPADAVKAIHDAGGIAMAPHPYHSTGIKDAVFDAPFDAVEIECGSVFGQSLVKRNHELAVNTRFAQIAKLGSSDAHYIRAIGSCYTVVRNLSKPTLESLKQAIIDGNCRPESSEPYRKLQGMLGAIRKLK